MSIILSTAFAAAVIASFVLAGFAIVGLGRGTMPPGKAWLMIAVAVITLLNVVLMAPAARLGLS